MVPPQNLVSANVGLGNHKTNHARQTSLENALIHVSSGIIFAELVFSGRRTREGWVKAIGVTGFI